MSHPLRVMLFFSLFDDPDCCCHIAERSLRSWLGIRYTSSKLIFLSSSSLPLGKTYYLFQISKIWTRFEVKKHHTGLKIFYSKKPDSIQEFNPRARN